MKKDTSTVFTWFQNNYLKANSGKPYLLTTSDNIQHINVGGGGNQLSSSKYEELLGILIDHKLTFENHLSNIVQKVNQKLHALAREVNASEKAENDHKSIFLFTVFILPTNLDAS